MRILIVHNNYRIAGGEDAVVQNESKLLLDKGHEVELELFNSNDIRGFVGKITTAINLSYSTKSRERITDKIRSFRPDVVHVHNFFPLVTSSVFDACFTERVPVVQTLHNFRTQCASALLLRNDKPCELCLTGTPFQAVKFGCYRESRLASLPLAMMINFHRKNNTWNKKITHMIALSEFSKNLFLKAGLDAEKISVKPNFVSDEILKLCGSYQPEERSSVIYVGRLSKEKGVESMVRAWAKIKLPLKIVGEGPLKDYLQRIASPNVQFFGKLPKERVYEEMNTARFLILPSICYENFPVIVAEAFALGLPVVASKIGSLAEIVEDRIQGRVFEAGKSESLTKLVQETWGSSDSLRKMSMQAKKKFSTHYCADRNYEILTRIYEKAIARG